jgi:hypothetical protein
MSYMQAPVGASPARDFRHKQPIIQHPSSLIF